MFFVPGMFFLHHLEDPTFSLEENSLKWQENLQFQLFFSNKKDFLTLEGHQTPCPKKLPQTIVRPNTPGLMMFKIWNPKVRWPVVWVFDFGKNGWKMAQLNLHPRNLTNRSQQWYYLKPVIILLFFLVICGWKKIDVFFDSCWWSEFRFTSWDFLKPQLYEGRFTFSSPNRCRISTNQKVSRFLPPNLGSFGVDVQRVCLWAMLEISRKRYPEQSVW